MPLTLEDMAAMITNNKEEIINKVDGIVEDVKEVKTQVNILTLREAVNEDSPTDIRIRKLLNDGRRVIGLSPVDQNDIDIEKEKGIENEEVAMISAAQSFFTEDMNIPPSTVAKMKIVKVFKPATADETDRLYVEFVEESSVNILNRYRRNLAAGLRIFPWFPPALYPTFKALDDKSYQIRKVRKPFHQADIRYEANDIAL